jgi:hypothetical protein
MKGRFSPEAFGFGVFLATVGGVFLLANLDLIDAIPVLKRIWPMFLIVWGVAEILGSSATEGGNRGGAE